MISNLRTMGVLISVSLPVAAMVFAGCSSPPGAEANEASSAVAPLSGAAPASSPRQVVDFGRFGTVLGPDRVEEGPLQVVYEAERDGDPNAACPLSASGTSGTRVVNYKIDDGPSHIVDLRDTNRSGVKQGIIDVAHGHHLQFWASTVIVTAGGESKTTCYDSDGGKNFVFPLVAANANPPGTVAFAVDNYLPFASPPATFRFVGRKDWNVALTAVDGDSHTFNDDVVISGIELSDPDGNSVTLRNTTASFATLPKDGVYTATIRGTAKLGLTPPPRIRFRWMPILPCHEGAHECPNPLRCAKETVQENSPSGRSICQ